MARSQTNRHEPVMRQPTGSPFFFACAMQSGVCPPWRQKEANQMTQNEPAPANLRGRP
jgi:hypothetical protein